MANRSHLYTCDEVPGGTGFHARGLSEFNWAIPLAHKLMAGTNPRIVRSAIWEHDIGILADREGAFERTIGLFDKLAEGDLPDREEFDRELAELKEFLATTPPSKYILLEAGEILDMMDGELQPLVEELHAELVPLAARAERAIAGQETDWVAQLRANWAEEARPGYWSDILYYSFDNTTGDSTDDDDDDNNGAAVEEPSKPARSAKPAAKKAAQKAVKPPVKKGAKKAATKAANKAAKPANKAAKPAKKAAKPANKAAKPANKAAKPASKVAKLAKKVAKTPARKAKAKVVAKPSRKRR